MILRILENSFQGLGIISRKFREANIGQLLHNLSGDRIARAYVFLYLIKDDNEKTPAPFEYKNDKINILNKAPGYSVGKTVPKQ
jgi:hypothetical protein